MIQRPLNRHNWSPDVATGRPVATNPDGQWDRGALYRAATPIAFLPPVWPVVDYSTTPPTYIYYAGGQVVRVATGAGGNPALASG